MPDQVDDVKGALSQFQVEFCTRYGIGPQFVADSLQNAMQKAFGTEARKRKLLGENRFTHKKKKKQKTPKPRLWTIISETVEDCKIYTVLCTSSFRSPLNVSASLSTMTHPFFQIFFFLLPNVVSYSSNCKELKDPAYVPLRLVFAF